MRPLRVLITNNRLDLRGGAESFVRDLARGLQRRGHRVMAYSSDADDGPRLLSNDRIPVTTDLANLPFKPDIIHGQHHLDAMTALMSLPEVPAIYHCHGAVWREMQPLHPRIYRYLAMSDSLAWRMVVESNIAENRVEVLLNSVDLARFNRVRSPMKQGAAGLFFNGHHSPASPTLAEIRKAVERHGISLQMMGWRVGGRTESPERLLPEYDIVFASGKSAIEAIACGCAVIVLGRTSCGELVRPENFDRLRAANFSIAENSPPPSADSIEAEILRYESVEAAAVTTRLREAADMELQIDRLEAVYREVIDEHSRTPADIAAEQVAGGRYLRSLVPIIKAMDEMQTRESGMPLTMAAAWLELSAQISAMQGKLDQRF